VGILSHKLLCWEDLEVVLLEFGIQHCGHRDKSLLSINIGCYRGGDMIVGWESHHETTTCNSTVHTARLSRTVGLDLGVLNDFILIHIREY
jgi:hypothetical protein